AQPPSPYWPSAPEPHFIQYSRVPPDVNCVQSAQRRALATTGSAWMLGMTRKPAFLSFGPTLARNERVAAWYEGRVGYLLIVWPPSSGRSSTLASSMTTPSHPCAFSSPSTFAAHWSWYPAVPTSICQLPGQGVHSSRCPCGSVVNQSGWFWSVQQ